MGGMSEVLYSDGQPLGDVTFEIQMPPSEPDQKPVVIVQMVDKTVYRLANDVLLRFRQIHH